MKFRSYFAFAILAGVVALSFAAVGCSKKGGIRTLIPNRRPSVEITSAPVDTRDTSFYAYKINWSGDDPDGRVDHFEYAVDATPGDTVWTSSTKNENTFFFKSSQPVLGGKAGSQTRSVDPHRFVIRAVDNQGLRSELRTRDFFSYTVAPTVIINSPQPSTQLARSLTPSVRISWQGSDPDGQFTQKPIKYKFKLFADGNPEFSLNTMLTNNSQLNGPDSLRRYYALLNFAGWDSCGGDTTTAQYNGLKPSSQYVFVVVAFDEAGAYSPNFGRSSNMLLFEVGFAGQLGPIITVFNEFFFYRPTTGGFAPDNPVTWQFLEVAASRKVTFNWFADPPPGALIQWYRWKLDGDVGDETPRSGDDDWYHWSSKSVGITSCTIGPFVPGIDHKLYIEAFDNVGLLSIVTIVIKPIQPTFDQDLLIVDDTRLEPDKFNTSPLKPDLYTEFWPSAAELDTFLYARGNFPWRGAQVTVPSPVSKPGVFAGYPFDTLGTRQGLEIQSNGVPLSTLGKYRHVIWMVDKNSVRNTDSGLDRNTPMGTLRWMSTPGHLNTLGSYFISGGEIWLLGGQAGNATLLSFNATGSKDNDTKYGSLQMKVYGNREGELVPGRLMYDAAHWQSEFISQSPLSSATLVKATSLATKKPWVSPGWSFSRPLTSPDYNHLPLQMNPRSLARGDSLPPTRTASQSALYFNTTVSIVAEYLSDANRIYEDYNPSPSVDSLESSLDSLMDIRGGGSRGNGEHVAMTYYHGVTTPSFIFSGFDIWYWSRADVVTLVDFVMHDIWGLNRTTAPSTSARPALYPAHATTPRAIPVASRSAVPLGRVTGR